MSTGVLVSAPATNQQPWWRTVAARVGTVTWIGVALLAVGAAAVIPAVWWGWAEAAGVVVVCAVVLLVAVGSVAWRSWCDVALHLPDARTVVGRRAVGEIQAHNPHQRSVAAGTVELPVGAATAQIFIPQLKRDGVFREVFAVPTHRRGVVHIGPARSVVSDAVGALRRTRTWSGTQTLWVHPRTVNLAYDTVGFQADIEGEVTAQLTSSDVSFHALRDYVPGDDRRHVHWATTARTGRLTVRQYEETRRSHHLILLDTQADTWPGSTFETAVSVAGSLALSGLRMHRQVSLATSHGWIATANPVSVLDRLTELDPAKGGQDASSRVQTALAQIPATSTLTVVTGPATTRAAISSWGTLAGPGLTTVGVRIAPGEEPGRSTHSSAMVLTCPMLDDLPRLASQGVR